MTPNLAAYDVANVRHADAEDACESVDARTLSMCPANVQDLNFEQLAFGCEFTANALGGWKAESPLPFGVLHVVVGRSEEEVSGVDARFHIAAVADEHARRDRSPKEQPCDAVCSHSAPALDVPRVVRAESFASVPEPKRPVTGLVLRALPDPAPVFISASAPFEFGFGDSGAGFRAISTTHLVIEPCGGNHA